MLPEVLLLAAEKSEAAKPVWGLFKQDYAGPFLAIFMMLVIIYVMIQRARADLPIPPIRKLAGLEAIEESVGRATEMGRPVHFTPGYLQPTSDQTIASYGALSETARMAARYDVRFIVTTGKPLTYAICEEIVKQSYLEAGRPDAFNPDDVQFNSTFQFSYAASLMGMMRREQPATNIFYGHFAAEAMMLIEQSKLIGAVTIGASRNTFQIPFFVAGCDYFLIGEEMYAASAYISQEPVLVGTVVGQDIGKVITVILIILGLILAQFGKANILESILTA